MIGKQQENGRKPGQRGVVNSISDVVSDITTLVDLQFELFKVDCAAGSQRIIRALIFGIVAVLMLAGTIPIGLATIAAALYEFADLNAAASLAITWACGFVVCIVAALFSFRFLKSAKNTLERSTTELKQNISWLKGLKDRGAGRSDSDPPLDNPFRLRRQNEL